MRALIDIKQIDISKLNDVKIYDELPLEVEGQVAYCQGKLYYGDGSEWNELGDGGGGLPEGTENQTLRHNGTEWVANSVILVSEFNTFTSVMMRTTAGVSMISGEYGDNYVNVNLLNRGLGHYATRNFSVETDEYYYSLGYTNIYGGHSGIYIVDKMNDNKPLLKIDSSTSEFKSHILEDKVSGTAIALLEATADGTIQRSATVLPTRIEYLSGLLSGTEHTFTGATLGITGDLRSRIKNIKCFAVDSSGDYNGALIANEFIYETDVTVNTTTNLSGSFKIILFIEYV